MKLLTIALLTLCGTIYAESRQQELAKLQRQLQALVDKKAKADAIVAKTGTEGQKTAASAQSHSLREQIAGMEAEIQEVEKLADAEKSANDARAEKAQREADQAKANKTAAEMKAAVLAQVAADKQAEALRAKQAADAAAKEKARAAQLALEKQKQANAAQKVSTDARPASGIERGGERVGCGMCGGRGGQNPTQ